MDVWAESRRYSIPPHDVVSIDMNQNLKRRRTLLPVLMSVSLLAAGGIGIAQVAEQPLGKSQQTQVSAPAKTAATLEQPTSERYPARATVSTSDSDPFLTLSPPQPFRTAAPSGAGTERYASVNKPIARGQSPESQGQQNTIRDSRVRPVAATGETTGNPLRSSKKIDKQVQSTGSAEARQAFGEVMASSAPIRVEPGAQESVQAAFEDAGVPPAPSAFQAGPVQPIESLPAESQLQPPAAFQLPQGDAATPFAKAQPESLQPSLPAQPSNLPSEPRQLAPPTGMTPVAPQNTATQSVLEQRRDLRTATRTAPSTFAAASPQTDRPQLEAPSGFVLGEQSAPVPGTQSLDSMSLATPSVGAGRPGERAIEGRQQPSLAVQKFAPSEIQVGKPCKFIVKIRNVGQRPAMGVVVRDHTPAGTRLMTTSPKAQTNGPEIRWELGTVSPGEERTLEMELTPTEEGEIGSVATVSFAAQASAKSVCTRPQLAIRMTAPKRVLVGRQQKVHIELHNPGTGDATGVMLLENVPENLRHSAGPALEFEVGTLRAGETRTMDLMMTAEKPGRVVNTLSARADGNLQVEQQVEFEVVAPELSVAVEGPSRRYLERPATYTVSVENAGTAAAKDVRLVTRLPQGMRFVKANNLGEYDASSHSVYWSLAELPEGERGNVKLTAMPVTPGDLTLQVEGQAREGLKDEAALPVRVEGIAALKFEVLDVEDPIEVGGETIYEVRVANQGTKEATNVRVRIATPAGMQPVAASGETSHSVEGGAVVFAPIERLAPQAESLFRVRVEGLQPGDHRLAVEVSSDDLAQPVRKEESTRVFGDE